MEIKKLAQNLRMITSSHNYVEQLIVHDLSKTTGTELVNVHDVKKLAQLEAIER